MDFFRRFRSIIEQNITLNIFYWLIVGGSIFLFFISTLANFRESENYLFLVRILCGWLLTIIIFMIGNLINNENIPLGINLIFATVLGATLSNYAVTYFPEDNESGLDMLCLFIGAYSVLIPSYKISTKLSELIKQKRAQYTSNSASRKKINKVVVLSLIIIVGFVSGIVVYVHPYLSYERTLAQLESQIGTINYNKYVDANDWIFSLNVHKIEYEYDSFTYSFHKGETLAQDNELSFYGTCTNGFEDRADRSKAELMCYVLSSISNEAEKIYLNSSYYEKFGKRLDNGETISYRNGVTINAFTTTYWLNLGTLNTDFYLKLDRNGEGDFVSKKYINEQEYYYSYDLKYTDGKLEKFQLIHYSTPKESGYFDYDTGKMDVHKKSGSSSDSNTEKTNNSNGSSRRYNKTDSYNSGRYKDADSFAEDYYEEFYDYEDYEDDDDAYDGAVDYWNDWND